MSRSQDATLLQLPHDVLVNTFGQLEGHDLMRLSATCRLLQYGQSLPQTPNAVEDALWLRTEPNFCSSPLPGDAREVVRNLLRHVLSRIAWQDLQLFSVVAGTGYYPLSLFVDSNARLRSCGMEGTLLREDHPGFLAEIQPAHVGALGFGRDWALEELHSDVFVLSVPTLVPATADVCFRSVATGFWHSLALTEGGEVYFWTHLDAGGPALPTLFRELQGHCVRHVSSNADHNAAITDRGELFTWCSNEMHFDEEGCPALGYPDSDNVVCHCPRRVQALDGVRIISVAAGWEVTFAVSDTGGLLLVPNSNAYQPRCFCNSTRALATTRPQAAHLTLAASLMLTRCTLFLCTLTVPRLRLPS
jgi:hypothetical protein